MTGTGTIFAAKCITCGRMMHRVGKRIDDGEEVPHEIFSTDHNGLTATRRCGDPRLVRTSGRRHEEIYAEALRLRGTRRARR